MEPIELELESAQTYSGGELSGTVRLAADQTRCRRIRYALAYDVKPGGATRTVVASGVLREGPFATGRTLVVPFRLKVPEDAPTTYVGTGLRLGWSLTVTADRSLTRAPAATVEVAIGPRPDNVTVAAPARYPPPPPSRSQRILAWLLLGPLAAILMLVLAAVLALLAPLTVIVGLLWFLKWLRVADCRLTLTPAAGLKLNEPLKYVFSFRARKRFRVNAVSVRLVGTEHWCTGSGDNANSHSQAFHEVEQRLLDGIELERGWFRQTGEFRLRPELPATAGDHLVYRLIARVDIPWWPDVVREVKVKVLPVIATAAAGPLAKAAYTVRRQRD